MSFTPGFEGRLDGAFAFPQIGGPAQHRGIDGGGADGIDSDIVSGVIQGHGAHECIDRALARRIGGDARLRSIGLHGRDGDDRAAAALAHFGNGELGGEEDALQIDVENVVPDLIRCVDDGAVALDAGAAGQNIDAPMARYRGLNRRIHVGLGADVADETGGIVPDRRHGFIDRSLVVRHDRHLAATRSKAMGTGETHSEAAAGDDDALAVEIAHHAISETEGNLSGACPNFGSSTPCPTPSTAKSPPSSGCISR